MRYEDITRVEVIDSIGGRAYVNSNANMPTMSFQDDGKTLKIFVHYFNDSFNKDNYNKFDPMNVLIVNGIPRSFEDVKESIRQNFEPYEPTFDALVYKLKCASKDTSLEAWRKEVAAGSTTLGYDSWRTE